MAATVLIERVERLMVWAEENRSRLEGLRYEAHEHEVIEDVFKFLASHIEIVRTFADRRVSEPYAQRMLRIGVGVHTMFMGLEPVQGMPEPVPPLKKNS